MSMVAHELRIAPRRETTDPNGPWRDVIASSLASIDAAAALGRRGTGDSKKMRWAEADTARRMASEGGGGADGWGGDCGDMVMAGLESGRALLV
jgi:hypothetical protein